MSRSAFGPRRARPPRLSDRVIYGEKDWSRPSDREANRKLFPTAEFTQVPNAGHFIALERPDVPADLLPSA
jgi:pimeloyl-ACP methyl ester carboxylesterase